MIVIKDYINKISNSYIKMFSVFLISPLVLGVIVTVLSYYNLVNLFFKELMDFSGFFLSLSNFLLFFLVYTTFKLSDYKKDEVNSIYLEGKAPQELLKAIQAINNCLNRNEISGLGIAILNLEYINTSLRINRNDVSLKAYSSDIRSIVSLIYQYRVNSIDSEEKLRDLDPKIKRKIIKATFFLIKHIEPMTNCTEKGED